LAEFNEQTGDESIRELVEWALAVQQCHFDDTCAAALTLAWQEDALATA
jgi:hypothetical protein